MPKASDSASIKIFQSSPFVICHIIWNDSEHTTRNDFILFVWPQNDSPVGCFGWTNTYQRQENVWIATEYYQDEKQLKRKTYGITWGENFMLINGLKALIKPRTVASLTATTTTITTTTTTEKKQQNRNEKACKKRTCKAKRNKMKKIKWQSAIK